VHSIYFSLFSFFFFFNDTATTEIYTLSLHDALPICIKDLEPWRTLSSLSVISGWRELGGFSLSLFRQALTLKRDRAFCLHTLMRSEEHTSELQSLTNLVCRLLLEKKKKKNMRSNIRY